MVSRVDEDGPPLGTGPWGLVEYEWVAPSKLDMDPDVAAKYFADVESSFMPAALTAEEIDAVLFRSAQSGLLVPPRGPHLLDLWRLEDEVLASEPHQLDAALAALTTPASEPLPDAAAQHLRRLQGMEQSEAKKSKVRRVPPIKPLGMKNQQGLNV